MAKKYNAIYQSTSAKDDINGGINELFINIGKRILDPNAEISTILTKEEYKKRGQKKLKDQIKNEQKKKKGCC